LVTRAPASAVPSRPAALVLAALLAIGLLLAGPGAGTAAAATCHPYPDVTSANPACANIAWLKETGITKPADGLYHPTAGVSRQAMTAFLFRLLNPGAEQPTCSAAPFPDVGITHPFCGYIRWAKDTSLAMGYADGRFGPARIVTRGAMAAFLYRIAHPGQGAGSCTTAPYQDVPVSGQFCAVITWMKGAGITYGIGGGRYGTALPVTRQAMASFLHRLSDIVTIGRAPTIVKTVTPFTADGRVRLATSRSHLGADYTCRPSPYSTAPAVYRCATTSNVAATCWVSPVRTPGSPLWCLRGSGDATVILAWIGSLPTASAASSAQPWHIVLDDGSQCGPVGGTGWPTPADGYHYTYGCDGATGGLVASGSGSTVVTSSTHWMAHRTATIGAGAPVSTIGVRSVVFAGAAPHVTPAGSGSSCAALTGFPATLPNDLHRGGAIACVGSWASVRYDYSDGGYLDVIFHQVSGGWQQVSYQEACTTPSALPAALFYPVCLGS